jgi:pSer/pThr/pTyr-binding forkhead associated (FHA) protein
MRICITVSSPSPKDAPGYRYEFDKDEVLVGRDEAVDVRLPHAAVSLVHLKLIRRKGRLYVEDTDSTNGTRLGGKRLPRATLVPVGERATLRIEPFELEIGPPDAAPASGTPTRPEDTADFARAMALELLGAERTASQPSLVVLNGPQAGARLALEPREQPFVVGRGEDCALHLDAADASREHLALAHDGRAVLARDLGSKNGVLVNGERLSAERPLHDGDELTVGKTRLRFDQPAERYLREVTGRRDEPLPEPAPVADEQPAGAPPGLADGPAADEPASAPAPGIRVLAPQTALREDRIGRGLTALLLIALVGLIGAVVALVLLLL